MVVPRPIFLLPGSQQVWRNFLQAVTTFRLGTFCTLAPAQVVRIWTCFVYKNNKK